MKNTALAFLLFALLSVLAAVPAFQYLPSVVQDFSVDNTRLKPAPEYELDAHTQCRSWLDLMLACSFAFTRKSDGQKLNMDYVIFWDSSSTSTEALKTSDGSFITSSYGLRHVENRALVMMLAVGLPLILGAGLLSLSMRRKKRNA